MLRRRTAIVGIALVLAMVAAGCGSDSGSGSGGGEKPSVPAGSTMEAIQKKGKLVVGTKFDQPLFGLKGLSGELEGFDTEIAREIAKAITGSPDNIEFVETVSKNREPFIQEGKVDIVVATYTINDKRKEVVDFAGPYYIAGQDIMVKKDDTSINGIQDLNGKKVCSVQGSTSEKNLKEKAPQAEAVLFDTYSKCAEALGDGRVQAVTTDNVILLGLIDKSQGAYRLVGKPFTEEPYGIGMKKGATDLRNFVNDELEKMYQDGRWKAAFEKTAGKVEKNIPEPPKVDRY
jgi:glutamate transport system substrate-binding protein